MADRSSRFYNAPAYTVPSADRPGGNVVLYQPRLDPPPPSASTYRVRPGDRPDLIAHTLFGDPYLYWRVADANPEKTLDDLATPGQTIVVPETR
jgi:hypothetical protein